MDEILTIETCDEWLASLDGDHPDTHYVPAAWVRTETLRITGLPLAPLYTSVAMYRADIARVRTALAAADKEGQVA